MAPSCQLDRSLGPTLPVGNDFTGCRNFDFTVAFEDLVFALLPNVAVLTVALLHIPANLSRPRIIDWPVAAYAKIALYCGLWAVELAELCLYAAGSSNLTTTRFTLPATSLLFVSVAALAGYSYLHHPRSVRPSAVIQIYLSLTLLLDAARLRTRWILNETAVAALTSAEFGLKLSLLLLESLPKHAYHTTSKGHAANAEEASGFFQRSLLLWLNSLLVRGYRAKLVPNDLYSIDRELASSKLTEKLSGAWKGTSPQRRRRLALSLSKVFVGPLMLVQLPRLALVGFAITQPLLISAALNYVGNHASLPTQFGPALIGAFALNYTAVAISTVWYQHLTFRMLIMVRGSLIGMIYKHSLSLPASDSNSGAEAVSLVSADIERILQTLQWVLNIVPNVIQVLVGLYILYARIGVVFVAPLIVAIACGIVVFHTGKRIPPRQRQWMQAIQRRVGVTSGVIGQIKSVKLSALTETASKQIQSYRESEIQKQKDFRRLQITLIGLGNTPAMLTPAVTFAAFAIAQSASHETQFQVDNAFTSLALLSIMINPIAELVTATTNLISALSCLDRIQSFLQKEALHDGNNTGGPSTALVLRSTDDMDGALALSTFGAQKVDRHPLIRVADASFGYELSRPILHNISLNVLPSTIVMILGPVGSGKSTLLRSLLGETYLLAGHLEYASVKQTAYCNQEPWLLNETIKQNILAFSEYNARRYESVIQACQLNDDFDQLPDGDQTLAGSKGVSLSGGQRARISLARAAYSGKPVIIMDDTFSGLDAITAARCFEDLMGKSGILRTEGRTVVFATHNEQWVTQADQIIVLDDSGRIKISGSFESLQKSNMDVVKLLKSGHDAEGAALDQEPDSDTKIEKSGTAVSRPLTEKPKGLIGPDEESQPELQTSPLRYYTALVGPGPLTVFVLLVVLHIGCNTAQPLWLKLWVAANVSQPNENVGRWVGVYVGFAVATIAFIAIQTGFFLMVIIPRVAKNLHQIMIDTTLQAPLAFFIANDSGKILNLFTGDLNLLDLGLPLSFLLTSEKIALVIAEVVLTCIASGYLAISIPFVAFVLYVIQRVYLRTSRQLRVLELELKAPLLSNFLSTFSGLTTIRAFSWKSDMEKQHIALLDESQRPYYLLFCLQRWLTLVLDLIAAGLATLLMGLAVALRDTMDPGYLGVALVSVMNFGQIVSALVTQWTNMETSLGAVHRIANYVSNAPNEDPHGDNTVADGELPANWPLVGEVVVKNVTASYGAQTVLKDINLVFAAGTKTAVCGRTGSGKSTLLGLLLRLSEPDRGSIAIDDVELSMLPVKSLRDAVIGLPQDDLLLSGTVRYNLDPFKGHIGDEALLRVLEKTGLGGLIEEKGGLDAELDLDWLSAGQRKLFCLARAMLRKSKVLLLDEATSSLDRGTEKLMNDLFNDELKDRTVIAVTHRPESVAAAGSGFDRVIVLQDGRVLEAGRPDALLAKEHSAFRALVKMRGT